MDCPVCMNDIQCAAHPSEEREVRPIKTEPTTENEALLACTEFIDRFNREGVGLRMEVVTSLGGARFCLTFSWDDMG